MYIFIHEAGSFFCKNCPRHTHLSISEHQYLKYLTLFTGVCSCILFSLTIVLMKYGYKPIKNAPIWGILDHHAEKAGFEPAVPFWSTHTFQACTLNHSVTSPFCSSLQSKGA